MKTFGLKVGILGGGQLARMICLQGHRLGLEMHILCPQSNEPAAQTTSHHHKGDPNSIVDLISFFKSVDLVTIESEFYQGDLLAEAVKKTNVPVFPNSSAISTLQDRLSQKKLLSAHDIETSPFIDIQSENDLELATNRFKKFVLKKRRGGYDGNGTFVIKSPSDCVKFLKKNSIQRNIFIAEKYIPFKRELAVIMARNSSGDTVHLPLVETYQRQNRCDWVYGPIQHQAIKPMLKQLTQMLASINYIGCIGFELFDTGQGLMVNEVAPRVHNTGHYSTEALNEDQFSLHLKSILNMRLKQPKLLGENFVMLNLIGGHSKKMPQISDQVTGKLHWYGKDKNRPGRKMGHINYVGKGTALLNKAKLERSKIKGL